MNFFQRPRRVRLAKASLPLLYAVDFFYAGTIGIYSSTPLNGVRFLVPQGGFEPPQADPESAVLPLHNRGINGKRSLFQNRLFWNKLTGK